MMDALRDVTTPGWLEWLTTWHLVGFAYALEHGGEEFARAQIVGLTARLSRVEILLTRMSITSPGMAATFAHELLHGKQGAA